MFAIGAYLNVTRRWNQRSVSILLAIFACWMVFHDGLRWGIATDWKVYLEYFNNCLWKEEEFEWGYVAMSKFIRSFTESYSIFLVVHACVVYTCFYKLVKRYSPFPLLSFVVLYYSMLSYLGMNRQYLSLAACLFAVPYIFQKKYFKVLCLIAIGQLFHSTAIMFVIALFLNRRVGSKWLWGIFFITVLIALSGLVNSFPWEAVVVMNESSEEKLDFYINNNDHVVNSFIGTLMGIARRSLIVVALLLIRNKVSNKYPYFHFMLNMAFVGLIFYILFSGTILQVIVARGLIYFNIFEVFLFPFLFVPLNRKIYVQTVYAILLLWGVYNMERGMNVYVNPETGMDIYRPYNAIYIDPTYDAHTVY